MWNRRCGSARLDRRIHLLGPATWFPAVAEVRASGLPQNEQLLPLAADWSGARQSLIGAGQGQIVACL